MNIAPVKYITDVHDKVRVGPYLDLFLFKTNFSNFVLMISDERFSGKETLAGSVICLIPCCALVEIHHDKFVSESRCKNCGGELEDSFIIKLFSKKDTIDWNDGASRQLESCFSERNALDAIIDALDFLEEIKILAEEKVAICGF